MLSIYFALTGFFTIHYDVVIIFFAIASVFFKLIVKIAGSADVGREEDFLSGWFLLSKMRTFLAV